jgi:hypothetical protein
VIDRNDLIQRIHSAAEFTSDQLQSLVLDICVLGLEHEGRLDDAILDALLKLLQRSEFRSNAHASVLVKVFDNEFTALTAIQREWVRLSLIESFGQFDDWMASYIIAIVLGEAFCDTESVSALMALAKTAPVAARQFIPAGLEQVVTGGSEGARKDALIGLQALSRDPDEATRSAASDSLRRLRR